MRGLSRTLGALFAASVLAATGWAAEPIAMWSNFSTTASGGYSFVSNENTVTDGVMQMTGKPARLESSLSWNPRDTTNSTGLVVAMTISELATTNANQTLIAVKSSQGDNRFGLTLNSNGNFYAIYNGSPRTNANANTAPSKACPQDSNQKKYIVVFKYTDYGTQAWILDITQEVASRVKCVNDTGCKDGGSVGTMICLGASYGPANPATGMKIHNVAIWNKDISEDTAFEVIKKLGKAVNASRAISGEAHWESGANWDSSMPTFGSSATLTVAGNSKLIMDKSVILQNLSIVEDEVAETQDKLTIAKTDSNKLTAFTTTINADTTVNAGAASLGAVTIAGGKTLTVGPSAGYSSLTSGTTSSGAVDASKLVVDAKTTPLSVTSADIQSAALKSFTGVVEFQGSGSNGATVEFGYANAGQAFKPRFIFNGGTHTMKYGCGDNLFSPGGTDEKPTILVEKATSVEEATSLTFVFKDLSGWNGSTAGSADTPPPSVIRVGKNGRLTFDDNGENTGYFRDRILLDSGAQVTNAHSDFYFYGGVGGVAQLAMKDDQGTATWNGGFKTDKSPSKIEIGSNSTLCLNGAITGSQEITKAGDGTLTLTGVSTNTARLTISAGTVKLQNNGSWAGAVTVSNGAFLEVEVADSETKSLANTLSGSGTVKKSGAGTLLLTGTVSTPVTVSAGTLQVGSAVSSAVTLEDNATLDFGTGRSFALASVTTGTGNTIKVKRTASEKVTIVAGTGLTSLDGVTVSVTNSDESEMENPVVALVDGTLTIRPASGTPTWTLNADGIAGSWSGELTDWPTSGTVIIDATALTTAATVALPASATFDELIVLGSSVKTTLTVDASTTIRTLSPSGYVAMAVSDVNNRVTDAVSVAVGGIFEVVAESDATLNKAISGAGKFAKGGTGTLTLNANITTTGGSIVQSGELKFSSTGYINASSASYADATGDVLVKSGATLNLAGRGSNGGLLLREVTLEENATFKNETTNIGTEQRQFKKLTLLGDAIVVADKNFGLLASGHGATTLTLNGHTLTKRGSEKFWLMNTTVNGASNGASGKIVVEAGSITNTGANKTVTFSTPITLESTLTGTPFNLTGATVTASENLTANGPVNFATLSVGNGKTLAGTGTVTVTDMSLGGVLNVTGNLVIDRTGATDPRSFANAIKVASGGSLTTKGDITWDSDSNEFLGSLTVASGTLAIKTPGQKLGGNITIARGATLTHAVKTDEFDKLDFDNPATIKVYGTLDMCKQRWTMRTHNKLYVYPGATVTGSGQTTYGAFDAEDDQANTISFCAADANSGSGEITFDSNLRARANWTLDVAEGVTVNLTGVRAQTTGNGDTGDYKDNYAINKTGAGKLIVNSNFRLNGACEGLIEVAAEKTLTLSGTVTHTAAFSGAGKILVTNDLTKDATPASSVTLDGTLGTVTGTGESAQASCALALEVASGSTLTLNNTVATTLSGALKGSGAITLGGTGEVNVTAANGGYEGTITINSGATLTNEDHGEPIPFGKGRIVNEGTLKLIAGTKVADYGCALLPPTSGTGDIVFCSGSETRLPAPITTTGTITFEGKTSAEATDAAKVTFVPSTTDYFFGQEASISGADVEVGEGVTLDKNGDISPTVTISVGKTLSGTGTIGVPLTFESGATLDVTNDPLTVTGTVTCNGTVTVTLPESPAEGREILKCSNPSDIVENLTATPMPTGLKFAANEEGKAVVLAAVPTIVIPPVAEGEGSVALSTESQATLLAVAQNQGLTEVRAVTGSTTVEGSETRLTAAQIDNALAVFGDSIVKADGTTLKVDYNFGIVAVEPYYYNGTLMSFIVKVKAETGTGDAATLASGVTINLVDGESGAVINDLYGRGFDGPDSNGIYAASFTSDDTVADRLIGRSFKVKATK